MDLLDIVIGPLLLVAKMEHPKSRTCAAFCSFLPIHGKMVQKPWSGEAAWLSWPYGALDLEYEECTSHPMNGEILLSPGGQGESGLLLSYGASQFRDKTGQRRGNHLMTIVQGVEQLPILGHLLQWQGAQDILIDRSKSHRERGNDRSAHPTWIGDLVTHKYEP